MKSLQERDLDAEKHLGNSAVLDKMRAERSKRCLYVYHSDRMKRLEDLSWASGKEMPAHIASQLSKTELQYFQDYNQLLSNYSAEATKCQFDVTVGTKPPTSLYVEVRVLEDAGEIMLPESGSINLRKNETHYLK